MNIGMFKDETYTCFYGFFNLGGMEEGKPFIEDPACGRGYSARDLLKSVKVLPS
jgi:hypothetical protein